MNHRHNQIYYKSKLTVKKLDKYLTRIFSSRLPAEREVIIYPTPTQNQMDLLLESARKAWLDMTTTNKNND